MPTSTHKRPGRPRVREATDVKITTVVPKEIADILYERAKENFTSLSAATRKVLITALSEDSS